MSETPRDCKHGQLARSCELCELERENAALRKENDTLRGLLGNSAKPCPYCGLAAEDQAKCQYGFPGCSRADDQMLSKHFADAYRAEQAEAQLAERDAEIARLRGLLPDDYATADMEARAAYPKE